MQSFVQYTPTKVVFGKDTQKEAGKLVSELGITKVFLVYGGGSVIRSGLLDEIKKSLDEEHIFYEEFGGVKPNPRLSFAREGVNRSTSAYFFAIRSPSSKFIKLYKISDRVNFGNTSHIIFLFHGNYWERSQYMYFKILFR